MSRLCAELWRVQGLPSPLMAPRHSLAPVAKLIVSMPLAIDPGAAGRPSANDSVAWPGLAVAGTRSQRDSA
jgi:hypothetical protein